LQGFAVWRIALFCAGMAITPSWAQSPFQSAPGPAPPTPPHPRPAPPSEIVPEATIAPLPTVPPKPVEVTVNYTVLGSSMPWTWVTGGLNTSYQFGTRDGAAPTVVDRRIFRFSPGDAFTLSYVAGKIAASLRFIFGSTDGTGIGGDSCTDHGWEGTYFPSRYMQPCPPYTRLMQLIGVFTDDQGALVGSPFRIGNGPVTVTVPNGATRMQLGINDSVFFDNTGSLTVAVTGIQNLNPSR